MLQLKLSQKIKNKNTEWWCRQQPKQIETESEVKNNSNDDDNKMKPLEWQSTIKRRLTFMPTMTPLVVFFLLYALWQPTSISNMQVCVS